MESYAASALAASGPEPGLAWLAAAEAAEPGAGQALVQVIGLLRTVKRRGVLDEMEAVTAEGARRIGQGVLQAALDEQAFAESWLPGVTGSDGVRRARRADSSTSLLTMLGHVRVRRAAYLSGDKGVPAQPAKEPESSQPATSHAKGATPMGHSSAHRQRGSPRESDQRGTFALPSRDVRQGPRECPGGAVCARDGRTRRHDDATASER